MSFTSLVTTACPRSRAHKTGVKVNDIVMAGGRTEQPNTSGDVQIHDGNLDIKRLDQTC
jgi:hypothetical protein